MAAEVLRLRQNWKRAPGTGGVASPVWIAATSITTSSSIGFSPAGSDAFASPSASGENFENSFACSTPRSFPGPKYEPRSVAFSIR